VKILCTGDKGFVGTVTTKLLESEGHEVIGYDLMDGYDIRDIDQLDAFVKENKPDRICHLAAIARFSEADADPTLAYNTNIVGTINVAKVAANHHVPVVYASTGSVYMPIEQEPPITEEFAVRGNSLYGCTKALGEFAIKEIASPYITLRYAHLFGKEKRHHGLIGGFITRIERGLAPELYGGGKQSNDFMYVDDVARANLLAVTAPWDAWNQSYNIGTGRELSAEEAGRAVCDVTGYKGEIKKMKTFRLSAPKRQRSYSEKLRML